MLKWFPAIALLLLSVACQQAPVRNEDSQWMRIAPGSSIVLHQELTVPAGQARVFLQNGKVVAKHRLNQYYPFCNFEIRNVSDGSQRIEPDTFLVTAIYEDEQEIVSKPTPFRQVAWAGVDGILNDWNMVSRFVRHTLYSERQPQVMRLTCHGGLGEPWQVHYPSISEIRHALGEIATVKLAGS